MMDTLLCEKTISCQNINIKQHHKKHKKCNIKYSKENNKSNNCNCKCNNINNSKTNNNKNNNNSNNINVFSNRCCNDNTYFYYFHHQSYSIKKIESGFYKFLARFSGRRRSLIQGFHKIVPTFIIILIVSLISVTEACSSRTTPKPRPPPTPAPRPNITFHTYKCPPNYAKWYCLNEATCFTVKIGDEILYNCECADGYMGPRCEYKDLDGSYLPTRPRVMLETASIASGATLALIFVLILCVILYLRWQQRQKIDTFSENGIGVGSSNGMEGIDTIDGISGSGGSGPGGGGGGGGAGRIMSYVKCEHLERRPFGPHHHYTIPMAATLKR